MAAADVCASDASGVKVSVYSAVPLGVLTGTASQLLQVQLLSFNFYLSVGALAVIFIGYAAIKNRVEPVHFLSWVVIFAIFGFALTGLRAVGFASAAMDPGLEGRDITVSGMVATMPQRNEAGLRFRFDVVTAHLEGQAVRLPRRLELAWYSGVFARGDGPGELIGELQRQPVPLQAGELWQFNARLKAPHGAMNPHGFDYELWQWEQGVQATGYVRAGPTDPQPLRLGDGWQHPVEWARGQVQDHILAHVTDPRVAGLIAALVVGDQAAIDRADWDVFRATGVAHLMSISGLHVTMFAWVAALVVGGLWRRSGWLCLRVSAPSAALVGGIALAAVYALFSGWGVPARRTIWMLTTVGLLRLLGLRWPWPQVWLLACVVVVLADPWALLQAGFWLSFVAVGVLFATDSRAVKPIDTGVKGQFLSLMHEQWVVTLALTPLSLLLFGQVSVVGLLANALAIPWVTLVVTPLAMLGALWPTLWTPAGWSIDLMGGFLGWLASLPWATYSAAQAPMWAGAAGVLGGVILALNLPWNWRAMGLPLMVPVLLWQAPRPAAGQFSLLAADIGQGNAVLVRTAHHVLLYDAGPRFSRESDAGHRVLVPLLRALDAPLDMLVLSHRDIDHTGGAQAVLMMQTRASLLSSIELENALQALRPAQRCVAGQNWQWDGVLFEVLHPQAADYGDVHKTNAMSCTLRISNGQQFALLAGDIEQAQEATLVERARNSAAVAGGFQTDLHAAVLLVPHHGSKTSSSAAFLDAVEPRFALVQAGYRNRFGHPASPVLVRYAERHIAVIDSPHCGAATWNSWLPAQVTCERDVQQRYWHHRVP